MKTKLYILLALSFALITNGCKDKGKFLVSTTGSAYEVLVVCNANSWKSEAGDKLKAVLASDVPNVPQSEPNLNISWCRPSDFDNMLKPTRNILFVEVDSMKYTKGSIFLSKDRWASPQAIVRITAPDDTTLANLIDKKGEQILQYFIDAERNRFVDALAIKKNTEFMSIIEKEFGIYMLVPFDINKIKQAKDTLWISTGSREARQDFLIYSYPYTDLEQLSEKALLQQHDSIVKAFIPGPVDGSYMGTEYKYDKPSYKVISLNKKYCAEIRGLWKIIGKISMGGPFISHTQIDEVNKRIVTVEGFVYAPTVKKRNPIRQVEAIMSTVKFLEKKNDSKQELK
jgi:hypothetical protein